MWCSSCSRPLAGQPSLPKSANILRLAVSIPAQKFLPSPVKTICRSNKRCMRATASCPVLMLLLTANRSKANGNRSSGLTRKTFPPHTRHPARSTHRRPAECRAFRNSELDCKRNCKRAHLLKLDPHGVIKRIGLLRPGQSDQDVFALSLYFDSLVVTQSSGMHRGAQGVFHDTVGLAGLKDVLAMHDRLQ